jgi:hypothetical protein
MLNETPAQSAAAFAAKAAKFYAQFAQANNATSANYYLSQAQKYQRFAQSAAARALTTA